LAVFEANLQVIDARNAANIAAGGEAVHGVNEFADMSAEEFKASYLMSSYTPIVPEEVVAFEGVQANSSIDWREEGVLTPIKNQGKCGSCWAFSAVSTIESYAKIVNKSPLLVLSPQQVTSCDPTDLGCRGGHTETAFRYVVGCGGIQLEADYPYRSGATGTSGTCMFNRSAVAMRITGYTQVARGETNLQGALAKGPVSVCLAAEAFQTYKGGILHTCPGPVDHCVQAVAYSATENTWTLRNQWGEAWGEKGFIRLARGNNLCQVANDATYPNF
jgi:cathepsin L